MKLQKFHKTLAFAMCLLTLAVSLTSCEKEEEPSNSIITYVAKGSITSVNDGFGALFAITDYTDAIGRTLEASYTMTAKDNEVIAACDAVFENHKTNHPTWRGHVDIEKTITAVGGTSETSTILKTYNYTSD